MTPETYQLVKIGKPGNVILIRNATLQRMDSGLILVSGTQFTYLYLSMLALEKCPIPVEWPVLRWRDPTWWEWLWGHRKPIAVHAAYYKEDIGRYHRAHDSTQIEAIP